MVLLQVWASGMPIAFGVYVWACGTEFFTDSVEGFLTLAATVVLWPLFFTVIVATMLLGCGDG
ncbi:MAG TPA: hypothetical protein VER11_34385 [Polyangiaceae bacterium]|nr:hypothetical protein [Polyangiaceae bacterium]